MTWRHAFEFLKTRAKESAREKRHVCSYLTRKYILPIEFVQRKSFPRLKHIFLQQILSNV